jgi:hypothetical protein
MKSSEMEIAIENGAPKYGDHARRSEVVLMTGVRTILDPRLRCAVFTAVRVFEGVELKGRRVSPA